MSHTITVLLLILSLAGNVAFLLQSLLRPTDTHSLVDESLQIEQTPTKEAMRTVATCHPRATPQKSVAMTSNPLPTQVSSGNLESNTLNTDSIQALTQNGTHLLTSAQQAQLAKQLQADPTRMQNLLSAIHNHQLSEQVRSQLVGIVSSQDSPRLFESAATLMQEPQLDSQRLGSELASRLIRHSHSVERTSRLLNDTSLPQYALRQIIRSSALLTLSASDKQRMHTVLADHMMYANAAMQPELLTSLSRLSDNDTQRLMTLSPYLTSDQPALQKAAIHALYQLQHGISPNSQAYGILESLANDQNVSASVRSSALALLANTAS